jgi:hypothetical protein
MNVPVLINIDSDFSAWIDFHDQTGEFFHDDDDVDLNDFQEALQTLLAGIDSNKYEPRKFVMEHEHALAGVKLKDFVMSHWADRVVLPNGTTWLIPSSGARQEEQQQQLSQTHKLALVVS